MKFLTHSFFIPTEYNVSGSAIEAQKEKSLQTGTMCQMDYVGRRMGCCHLRVRLPPDRRETRVLVADATLVIPAHYFLRSALSPAVACVNNSHFIWWSKTPSSYAHAEHYAALTAGFTTIHRRGPYAERVLCGITNRC